MGVDRFIIDVVAGCRGEGDYGGNTGGDEKWAEGVAAPEVVGEGLARTLIILVVTTVATTVRMLVPQLAGSASHVNGRYHNYIKLNGLV